LPIRKESIRGAWILAIDPCGLSFAPPTSVKKWYQPKQLWPLLKVSAADWSHDHAPRLGAALAYYTIFSIVPLLIIIIAIIGLVFGQEAAQSAIMDQISRLVGPQSAAAIKDMIQRADQPSTGIISTIIATITLLMGAAGFFGQLKDALNTVWGIAPKEGRGIWGFVKDNLLSFATVVGTAFLLLVSLVISTGLAAVGKWFGNLLPLPEVVLQGCNLIFSLVVITALFALIFKVLPDAHIRWRDVWIGAALTAVLFTIGKFAIELYLGKSHIGSSYGAAGSLIVVLVWVYYSVQILLYGAEFTQVYANLMGHRIQPTEEATVVDSKKPQTVASQVETDMSLARDPKKATLSRWGGHWVIPVAIVGVLILTVLMASSLLSEPIKNYAERQANERLPDFDITIGKLHLQPFRLGIGVEDLHVRLRAKPDPPLAEIAQVKAHIRFLPLFTGKLDVNLQIEGPQFSATSQQVDSILHTSKQEETKQKAVAWQDTMRKMMPIHVSLSLSNGAVRYHSDPHVEPIQLHQLQMTAANVTNRPPENEPYPSELRVKAHLADNAEVALNSHVDLLAKPSPRMDGDLKVQHLTLPTLRPLVEEYNVQLRQGAFDMTGHVKYSSPTTVVDIHDFVLENAKVDYIHTAPTKDKEAQRAKKGAEHVKDVHKDPSVVVKVSHGKILHSDVGFIDKAASPDYRVFLSDMNLDLENFSNRPEDGMGNMKLTGNFMGSGPTVVIGSFRPEKPNPDFTVQVRIVKTQVTALNKLLEAYGQMDAKQGTFAFFSDMRVKNNRIEGYVKPFLKDVEVYDPEQDTDKQTLKKLYEAVVNGVLDLFTSRPTGQVATETDVSGPVENPHSSTWQILEKLVQNAFFKAILPGFEERRNV
jgi:membrane protein